MMNCDALLQHSTFTRPFRVVNHPGRTSLTLANLIFEELVNDLSCAARVVAVKMTKAVQSADLTRACLTPVQRIAENAECRANQVWAAFITRRAFNAVHIPDHVDGDIYGRFIREVVIRGLTPLATNIIEKLAIHERDCVDAIDLGPQWQILRSHVVKVTRAHAEDKPYRVTYLLIVKAFCKGAGFLSQSEEILGDDSGRQRIKRYRVDGLSPAPELFQAFCEAVIHPLLVCRYRGLVHPGEDTP